MLVAQTQIEGLSLVTHDRRLGRYDVELVWT
jgi:PIN domain nuclease of toxin-antitoxin system